MLIMVSHVAIEADELTGPNVDGFGYRGLFWLKVKPSCFR